MGAVTGLLLAVALLAPERLETLPQAARQEWQRYVETSRRQAALDREALAGELSALGRKEWTPAPGGPAFALLEKMDPARRADILVSFQTPTVASLSSVPIQRHPLSAE